MTMDEFKKKFAEIEKEMMEADHQNEFLQPPLWAKLSDLMSEDLPLTIEFLDNATEDEVDTAFCVVEDVAQRHDSQEYIDCLYRLCDKYPRLDMRPVAELAEAFMKELRLENKRKRR
ncbi:MAG: hypothetical protein IKE69_08410 [Thermoguttaceae bacterium]|nr:hypothetical protein [Thermoguttaceae bacterium]